MTTQELQNYRNTYPWLWYLPDKAVEDFSVNQQVIELYNLYKLNHYENQNHQNLVEQAKTLPN